MLESRNQRSRVSLAAAIASALFLAACGGGSSGGSGGGNTGGGGGGNTDPDPVTVSGKAADGYLAGATVCLDLDANMKCDEGEPTQTTGAGGAFTLTIPEDVDAGDYAIVVEVSAATIDEDTGLSVGKPYVLSAPAGVSDFISPLTTAVHGIVARNPALTVDEAVAQVKSSIGASSDVSLFEDYVAAKQDADNEAAEEYERLHRIAQVTAKVMAENHELIIEAAGEQGIDPAQSNAALFTLVVDQVLSELESSAQAVDDAGDDFDVDSVSVQVADVSNLTQQIETINVVGTGTKASIESVLEQGVYWIWGEDEEFEQGFMKAAEQAGRLQETWSLFIDGVWQEMDADSEDVPSILGAEGWTQVMDTAPNFSVTYQADGTALLDLDGADLTLKYSATEVDVGGKAIKDFLGFEAHQPVAQTISGNPLFSTGAKIYQVNFIATLDVYEIDNWYDCEAQHADPDGNCNVIFGYASNAVFQPAQSFEQVIYPSDPASGNWFSVGENLDVRIVQDGVVRITDNSESAGGQVSYGSWEYRTVHGEQLMVLTLPTRFNARLWDDGQPILAVVNGYVRRGGFIRAGTPEEIGEIQFNEIAFQDIRDNSSVY